MTVVRPNSIAGINSITVQTGQALNVHDASGNLIRSLTNSSGISTYQAVTVTSGDLIVGTSDLFVDNSTGRTGVGTATPGNLLTVNGRTETQSITGHAGTNTDLQIASGHANSNVIFHVGQFGSTADEKVRINTSGSVGIGTSNPQVKLTVSSDSPAVCDIHHIDGGTGDEARIILGALALNPPNNRGAGIAAVNNGAGHDLIIKCSASHSAGPTEKLRVKSSGLVGINSDAPSKQLEVQGLDVALRLKSTVATGRIGMEFYDTAAQKGFLGYPSSGNDQMSLQQNEAADFYCYVNGADRLRIRADGRTSIGSSLAVAGVTTAAAFVPSKGQLSNRNIAINGAMQVAQRDTSNTNSDQGYRTCDRFTVSWSGLDSVIEQHQVALTSGTPYNLGFRHAWQLKNGDQTGGADAGDYIQAEYRIEGRDLAQSGWDYVSSSSYITLSFWLKTSVQQDFTINFTSFDGTSQRYPMKTGTIAANTWTKITKTVPGGSNVQFDNDTGKGMAIMFYPYLGNSYVGGSSLNTWSAASTPNFGGSNESAWYTTNDATFEVTGFQLEVGEYATPFEHRSYAEDLSRCQRYFQRLPQSGDHIMWGFGRAESNSARVQIPLGVPLRAAPTITCSNNRSVKYDATMVQSTTTPTVFQWKEFGSMIILDFPSGGSLSHNNCYIVTSDGGTTGLRMDSEL